MSPAKPHITILTAEFGSGKRVVSVVKQLQDAIDADPFLPIVAASGGGGDPAPGISKTLTLSYQIDKTLTNVKLPENQLYEIPPIPNEGLSLRGASATFKVIAARYGAESRWVDATEIVRTEIQDPSQPLKVHNYAGGKDLWIGKPKKLMVWFEIHGRRFLHISDEGETMTLIPK